MAAVAQPASLIWLVCRCQKHPPSAMHKIKRQKRNKRMEKIIDILCTFKIWPVIAISSGYVRFIKGKFSIKMTCFIDLKSYKTNFRSMHSLYAFFSSSPAAAFVATNELIHLYLTYGLIRFCNVSGEKKDRISHFYFSHKSLILSFVFCLVWLSIFAVRFRFLFWLHGLSACVQTNFVFRCHIFAQAHFGFELEDNSNWRNISIKNHLMVFFPYTHATQRTMRCKWRARWTTNNEIQKW